MKIKIINVNYLNVENSITEKFFQSFVESACFYYGQIIQILHNIDSIDACQEACQYYPPCKYFTYSKTNKICDLLSSPDRLCDHFIGTPTPNIENCVASTVSTTMSKSTTTVEIKGKLVFQIL